MAFACRSLYCQASLSGCRSPRIRHVGTWFSPVLRSVNDRNLPGGSAHILARYQTHGSIILDSWRNSSAIEQFLVRCPPPLTVVRVVSVMKLWCPDDARHWWARIGQDYLLYMCQALAQLCFVYPFATGHQIIFQTSLPCLSLSFVQYPWHVSDLRQSSSVNLPCEIPSTLCEGAVSPVARVGLSSLFLPRYYWNPSYSTHFLAHELYLYT